MIVPCSGGRRVEALVPGAGDRARRHRSLPQGKMPKASFGRMALGASGRGAMGNGWVGDEHLARRAALGNRPLDDRDHWRPGVAVEGEEQALLGRLQDGRLRRAVPGHHRQGRLGRVVVVPQVVMDGLERPDRLRRSRHSARRPNRRRRRRRGACRPRSRDLGWWSAGRPGPSPRRPTSAPRRWPAPATMAGWPTPADRSSSAARL